MRCLLDFPLPLPGEVRPSWRTPHEIICRGAARGALRASRRQRARRRRPTYCRCMYTNTINQSHIQCILEGLASIVAYGTSAAWEAGSTPPSPDRAPGGRSSPLPRSGRKGSERHARSHGSSWAIARGSGEIEAASTHLGAAGPKTAALATATGRSAAACAESTFGGRTAVAGNIM